VTAKKTSNFASPHNQASLDADDGDVSGIQPGMQSAGAGSDADSIAERYGLKTVFFNDSAISMPSIEAADSSASTDGDTAPSWPEIQASFSPIGDAPRRKRKRRPPSGAPLNREQIVNTALALVDRDGLKALSMRRLGAELGVDPMAVYYHIPKKEALLDAIVEAVMASIDLTVYHPEDSSEERVMCAAKAYRDAMLAHANALPIVLSRGPATAAALRPVELLIGILREAGLPPAKALAGMNTIAAAVRGFVGMIAHGASKEHSPEELARQIPAEDFPHLRSAMPFAGEFADHGFDFGIRSLARGLIAEAQSGMKLPEGSSD
jgi:AcrR family transcriptional regulator